MKPVIGIVGRVAYPGNMKKMAINDEYRNKIIEFGGNPICILPVQDIDYGEVKYSLQNELTDDEKDMLIKQISFCDGILLPGGFKINKFDRFICEYAIDNDIPLLGICLGMQIMSNYKRDILWNEKNSSNIDHYNGGTNLVHNVSLDKNSYLYSIINSENIMVTSRHNYHVLDNSLFKNVGFSDDGYIEAIEYTKNRFCIGVQWHPEDMNDNSSKGIFEAFINASLRK